MICSTEYCFFDISTLLAMAKISHSSLTDFLEGRNFLHYFNGLLNELAASRILLRAARLRDVSPWARTRPMNLFRKSLAES